ncbi:hypothetical protein RJ641_001943 [Dillenia turbinata]|uniref:Uncharacterized protein n=1 Tax=Dillenia turbinata TaxID=194707 RepID=A0AAN8VF25_9MAGN
MTLLKKPYGYTKMEMEDPEDVMHRRAQFLIYKVLEQADMRRRPSTLRVRICGLKVKIGKRLKRLRKSMPSSLSMAKLSVYRQARRQLKAWKAILGGGARATLACLPPLFS